ncbi:MAG: relaxase/mobilization nuclease domain-containing protein [Bacteroidetes bacterium]|nr:relaxase/mobilization nuclease domain-containing protein [Bacteroidota bacterium]
MIAKMKSNLSVEETLLYNDREKSEIISIKNLVGENFRDVEKQMAMRQKLFAGRAKNLTAHIIISPSIDDGKRQTRLDWKEIGDSFLKKAELNSYQSIAYLHKDKEHFHLHIVVNRIDPNGKIFRHKNELALSQRLGDEIAIERGLKRASEIRRQRRLGRDESKINPEVGIVAQIRKVASKASVLAFVSGKFDQKKYFECIKGEGLEVRLFFKKDSDEVRGYAIGKKGERLINASQIGSEFTLRRLKQGTDDSKLSVEFFNSKIRDVIETSFQKTIMDKKRFEPQLFLNELRSTGHVIKEYYNKDTGKLRGYGFEIDQKIINSSEIGSEFTLTNLKRKFEQNTLSNKQRSACSKVNEPKLEPGLHHNLEEDISKELRRAIDIRLLSSELHDLTSGHRYRSQDDFIKAVEEKGYHVHLRYDQGSLSGFTLHKGTEHYHDHEISNGEFQIHQLIKQGTFKNFHPETIDKTPQTTSAIITGTSLEDTSTGQSPVYVETQNVSNDIFLHFVKRESKKKRDSERERIRQIIAKELARHIQIFYEKGLSFGVEKYLDGLQADGYKITRHFNKENSSIRGYNLEKYGFNFHASEVGREFTLKYLGGSSIQTKKISRHS